MSGIDKDLGILHQAIAIERFGHDFYTSLRPMIKDIQGQMLVSYLARLELDHIMWLEEEYKKQLAKLSELHEEKGVDISLVGKGEIFLDEDNLPDIYRDFDPVRALEFAVRIESRSVAFYEKNMEIASDDGTKDLYKRLADFERDHIVILNENQKSLQEGGQWKPFSMEMTK
jgi:rubrerythrin